MRNGRSAYGFKVEKSKQNNGWVLAGDRKFNAPFLFIPTGVKRRSWQTINKLGSSADQRAIDQSG